MCEQDTTCFCNSVTLRSALASNVQHLHALSGMGAGSGLVVNEDEEVVGHGSDRSLWRRKECCESLMEQHLFLTGALQSKLSHAPVAIKRQFFGEAANATRNIAGGTLGDIAAQPPTKWGSVPSAGNASLSLAPPMHCSKQGVRRRRLCEPRTSSRTSVQHCWRHVVVESYILILQDRLQSERLVTASGYMQHNSAIGRHLGWDREMPSLRHLHMVRAPSQPMSGKRPTEDKFERVRGSCRFCQVYSWASSMEMQCCTVARVGPQQGPISGSSASTQKNWKNRPKVCESTLSNADCGRLLPPLNVTCEDRESLEELAHLHLVWVKRFHPNSVHLQLVTPRCRGLQPL